ncbi:nuclear pore complex protein Nup50 [Cavia porcellus]|uniref:Nuclear pore complex protein Nup50 n=1 Tax=Cavia porcellus TaxID=10141 RepID=H0VWC0_CAVPO|nr:nuclear pore complex protein Nup50 [Cavia porcellus]
MAKRIAEKELTDRNWDQEDEAEELGTFSVASEEVLKTRAIKKAKRRNVGFESDGGGAFKGFKGLVVPSGGAGFSAFGGKPLEGLANGTSVGTSTAGATEPRATFGTFAANGPIAVVDKTVASPKADSDSQQPSCSLAPGQACPGNACHKQLAALNCSVRDWIVQHVDANPVCDLTPVFKDYERYLAGIGQQSPGRAGGGSESRGSGMSVELQPAALADSAPLPQEPAFLFSGRGQDAPEKKAEVASERRADPVQAASAAFHFGKKLDSSVLGSLSPAPPAGFSFTSGTTGLFGKDVTPGKAATPPFPTKTLESPAAGGGSESKGGDEEESEEPPKVVVTEVKEEDAFYSKKCKLFYKKDNEFKEKGVGTLHLKPTASQKTQLLVRADTNLGNILLNVLVPPNMPCSRTGKNNVLIVCVPNPPLDEKSAGAPATMLIRVKTSEDADELHRVLLEKKEA